MFIYCITNFEINYPIVPVTIKATDEMEGVQLGTHSASGGSWEVLYGEFISFPSSIQGYKYYSDVVVSLPFVILLDRKLFTTNSLQL